MIDTFKFYKLICPSFRGFLFSILFYKVNLWTIGASLFSILCICCYLKVNVLPKKKDKIKRKINLKKEFLKRENAKTNLPQHWNHVNVVLPPYLDYFFS